MLLVSGVAWAAKIRCERGSLAQNNKCHGTKNPDLIRGTIGRDYIIGRAPRHLDKATDRDTIHGYAKNDKIFGGFGKDRLYGGSGDDNIYGGPHSNKTRGGSGDDYLSVGINRAAQWVAGDTGNDRIFGHNSPDTLYGGRGADALWGWPGIDHLYGDAGPDTIDATDGADFAGPGGGEYDGKDYVSCGDGFDKVFADDEGVDEIAADTGKVGVLGS